MAAGVTPVGNFSLHYGPLSTPAGCERRVTKAYKPINLPRASFPLTPAIWGDALSL
jgi:hypothetical protein